jgi:hypothetical protein
VCATAVLSPEARGLTPEAFFHVNSITLQSGLQL